MPDNRHVGRARVRRRPVGRARVGGAAEAEPSAAQPAESAPEPAQRRSGPPPETGIVRLGPPRPPPVFVDETGRRRERWRAVVIGVAILALLMVAALWLSQAGGPVSPKPVLPCTPGAHGAPAPEASC